MPEMRMGFLEIKKITSVHAVLTLLIVYSLCPKHDYFSSDKKIPPGEEAKIKSKNYSDRILDTHSISGCFLDSC